MSDGATHRGQASRADRTLSTFRADATIPLGHPCMGGGIAAASTILDPLEAIDP
jgi:hypothetical protein